MAHLVRALGPTPVLGVHDDVEHAALKEHLGFRLAPSATNAPVRSVVLVHASNQLAIRVGPVCKDPTVRARRFSSLRGARNPILLKRAVQAVAGLYTVPVAAIVEAAAKLSATDDFDWRLRHGFH